MRVSTLGLFSASIGLRTFSIEDFLYHLIVSKIYFSLECYCYTMNAVLNVFFCGVDVFPIQ